MLLRDILYDVEFVLISGTADVQIDGIAYDSRKVQKGDVYVCLRGVNADGHDFIREAVENGAVAVICDRYVQCGDELTVVKVADAYRALAKVSINFFKHPQLKVIGITGTKGKTITVCMIKQILENAGEKCGMIGTMNIFDGKMSYESFNTTPQSYDIQKYFRKMVDNGCKYVVMEVSSLGLKWDRTYGIMFDCAVFTNFSEDHIGENEHASVREYMSCKRMLFDQCSKGFVNADDEQVMSAVRDCECSLDTFGILKSADISAYDLQYELRKDFFGVSFCTRGNFVEDVLVPMLGKFNVYNALAAISVCKYLGISAENILNGILHTRVKGRGELVCVPRDFVVLIDYAHNAFSLKNILSTLRLYHPKRLITLFGCGGDRSKVRRYYMGRISGEMSDITVVTMDNPRSENFEDIAYDIKHGLDDVQAEYVIIKDRADAIRYGLSIAEPGDVLLLAGKGHETYQIVGHERFYFDERDVVENFFATTL